MSAAVFPADSFAAVRTHLRAPFPVETIRGRICKIPEGLDEPCLVYLYVTSATIIERLNLFCSEQWKRKIETVREERLENGDWHVKKRALVTVFGQVHEGEGMETGSDRALVEFAAGEQAFKRAARLFECGQHLYEVGLIKMRRGEGENELRVDADGQPYMDRRSEAYGQRCYQEWLARVGIERYGQPIGNTSTVQRPPSPVLASEGAALAAIPTTHRETESQTPSPQTPGQETDQPALGAGEQQPSVQHDQPGPYSPRLRTELCCLLGQDSGRALPAEQQQELQRWLDQLAAMAVPERAALVAVKLAIERSAGQQEAQRRFTRWLARHAENNATRARQTHSPDRPPQFAATTGSEQPTAPVRHRPPAACQEQQEHTSVLAALQRRAKDGRCPTDLIDALARLACGSAGAQAIRWEALPAAALSAIANVLDCAEQLGWSAERLLVEIASAETESPYRTAAGRFTALVSRVRRAAETQERERPHAAA